eukprot:TRINITY_DN73783_c0_g1_i1.p1 TRINITY_DN73783_c0_g1~~TRINITY_DN73783_c0_g1_i1.p1  ORF type:complete len:481 (-),score=33.66 TRINITY_DN73783_c0_g1_i1:24-1427(-)
MEAVSAPGSACLLDGRLDGGGEAEGEHHIRDQPRRCCCRRRRHVRPPRLSAPAPSLERATGLGFGERILSSDLGRSSAADAEHAVEGVARLLMRRMSRARQSGQPGGSASRNLSGSTTRRCRRFRAATLAQPGSAPYTSADFEEVLFVEPPPWKGFGHWLCRAWRRSRLVTTNVTTKDVLDFLLVVASTSEFRLEVTIVSAIYIERLLHKNPLVFLNASTWRPILLAALHLASKMWEDIHALNSELSEYLERVIGVCYPAKSLHLLEMQFLMGIDFRVDVGGEEYAAYLFSLSEEDRPQTPPIGGRFSTESKGRPRSDPDLSSVLTFFASGTLGSEGGVSETNLSPGGLKRSYSYSGGLPSYSSSSPSARSMPSWTPKSRDDDGDRGDDGEAPPIARKILSMSANPILDPMDDNEIYEPVWSGCNRLDPKNPFVGWFRHAPRAAPPSCYIGGRKPHVGVPMSWPCRR